MKKAILLALSVVLIIFSLIIFLNIETTTKQGINGQVRSIKIPLYLKILNFYDRHFNYKWMIGRIIKDEKTEEEKALKLFEWAYHNIKIQPADLPVVDDHVWHIIVRGYGTHDQASDVFATLCDYVGVEAFLVRFYSMTGDLAMLMSLVKLKNKWRVFDPFNGVTFINNNGEFASLEDIKNDDWQVNFIANPKITPQLDYSIYFKNIPEIKEMGLQRSNTQSPLNRMLLQMKRWSEFLFKAVQSPLTD